MTTYTFPVPLSRPEPLEKTVYTMASGDLRLAANVACWPLQREFEARLTEVLDELGWSVHRTHEELPGTEHGFIDSQRRGLEVFATIPKSAPILVIETVWQYSHHVLAGLRSHEGPILVVANFAGDYPGLVGLLNLTASLTKAGVDHSILWSRDFRDSWAIDGMRTWLETGHLDHDTSHVMDMPPLKSSQEARLGRALADQLRDEKAILGVFDEGCMGMYNAIFDDEIINPAGLYKERLSQSALYAEMQKVTDDEARGVRAWLDDAGITFHVGTDEVTELTEPQLHEQMKMYVAALRVADDFGCDAIGIQYQQGLKDTCPASDLVEGLLNDPSRPPVLSRDKSRELYAGRALPHFNEVDEGVAVDSLVTNRVWTAMGLNPATTLHDVRWGDDHDGQFVWVMLISGSVPAFHLGGYKHAHVYRQTPMYFPLGGGTLSGVSKPGELVWSRVFLMGGAMHADIGRCTSVDLPAEETQRRLDATAPNWPILNAFLPGVSRDQLMARHKANHANFAYAPDDETAGKALIAKAAMFQAMGIEVHLCGDFAGELT